MHDIHAICIQLGDLKAMERLRRTLKPGGYCLLAVPVGADAIVWNAHRKYGRLRLPVLFHRWSLVAQFGLTRQILDDPNVNTHIQPVFVIKNEYERAGGVGGKDERDGDSGDEEVRSGLREASLLSDSIDWDTVLTSKPVDGTPALPRERNCLPQAAQGSTWMQCFFCPGDGVFEWTHPTTTDPMAFDACSDTHSCAPISFQHGRFRAVFPREVGTVVVFEMWDKTDWKMQQQPSHYARSVKWSGCNESVNFINAVRCTFHVNSHVAEPDINVHSAADKRSFAFNFSNGVKSASTLYVVGDSTMKRLFDSLIRLCSERPDFHAWGKVRSNVHAKCGSLLVKYLWSAGDDDTSAALKRVPAGPAVKVIFNTGHNYHLLNVTDFTALVQRMRDTVRVQGWAAWALLTSPAFATHRWDPQSRCIYNNIRVQMFNQVLQDTFPADHVVDMYYESLQSGDAVDGAHFRDEYYDTIVQRILHLFSKSPAVSPAPRSAGSDVSSATCEYKSRRRHDAEVLVSLYVKGETCVEGLACERVVVMSGLAEGSQYRIAFDIYSGTRQVYHHDEIICTQPATSRLDIAVEIPPLTVGMYAGEVSFL